MYCKRLLLWKFFFDLITILDNVFVASESLEDMVDSILDGANFDDVKKNEVIPVVHVEPNSDDDKEIKNKK